MSRKRLVSGALLTLLVLGAAYVAINLQRRGHTTGDDWALYVRMAKSLFEGNIADVISDNRFLFDHSTAVTPPIYPWGWPLLLSPFVRVWGIDFDRLKLVEVAVFCAWLVLYHGIVRRRAGRIVALALTAVFATSYLYLVYTDQLLTEYPHMLAVAIVIWWLDRMMDRGRLTAAPTRDLIILGLLAVAAYNVRREGLMLVFAIAGAQRVDLAATRSGRTGRQLFNGVPWKTLLTPYLTFAAGAVTFQLLLPSTLVPDNGNSPRYIATRLWSLDNQPTGRHRPQYPAHLVSQLGLHEPAVFGRWMIGLAAVGAIVGCVKAPRRNVPLAVLGLTTMLVIGTHLRMVSRYYMQITPLIVFFVALLLLYVVGWLGRLVARRPLPLGGRRIVALLAAAPFLWLAVYHATDLPRRVDATHAFNDSGAVQRGPAQEQNQTAMDAIDKYTRPDDIVVYYRARTATLYTGRQALQTTSLNNMVANGDWFMQNKKDNYSQVVATPEQLTAAGFELVWENNDWRVWRIPDGPVDLPASSPDVQPVFDGTTVTGSSR
ncbi:MAG TPA: glycosyltransferase family 39 protein [Desertimonas sp.]|nr:glycosyltransferase family 39 protein [Desertimonas sp.]